MQQNFGSTTMEQYFADIIKKAGAEFLGLRDGQVSFRADADSPVCRLYPYALRSVVDVELAIKSAKEKKMAAQWEFTSPTSKGRHA
jgi:hypothetical protein